MSLTGPEPSRFTNNDVQFASATAARKIIHVSSHLVPRVSKRMQIPPTFKLSPPVLGFLLFACRTELF